MLCNSDLKIERELAGLDDWTPEDIAKRQKALAQWALSRWHVDAPPPLPNQPWERQLEQARRNGVEKEFLELREIAIKLGLQLVAYQKSVAYASPYNMNQSALTVRTFENILDVYVRTRNIPIPKTFSRERVNEILNGEGDWWMSPDQFGKLKTRLEQLLLEMTAKSR